MCIVKQMTWFITLHRSDCKPFTACSVAEVLDFFFLPLKAFFLFLISVLRAVYHVRAWPDWIKTEVKRKILRMIQIKERSDYLWDSSFFPPFASGSTNLPPSLSVCSMRGCAKGFRREVCACFGISSCQYSSHAIFQQTNVFVVVVVVVQKWNISR